MILLFPRSPFKRLLKLKSHHRVLGSVYKLRGIIKHCTICALLFVFIDVFMFFLNDMAVKVKMVCI